MIPLWTTTYDGPLVEFLPENRSIYNGVKSGLTTIQKKSQKIRAAKSRKQIGF